jgi:hypothetical protein
MAKFTKKGTACNMRLGESLPRVGDGVILAKKFVVRRRR